MADNLLSTGFSYFGWAFLPAQATRLLQGFYYRVTIPAGQRHPQPGDPLYAIHHRRIRVFVLSLYLLYTLTQALYDIKLAGDFYSLLGVTPASTERDVKSKFRRLAAKYHPDKIREDEVPEDAFLQLKLAQDTIMDPAKRFAYDRFGPAIVRVTQPGLKTARDYVYAGLRAKMPEYLGNAVMLVVLNYVWLPKWGQFWRYFVVASMAFLELYFLTHDWKPPVASVAVASTVHAVVPKLVPGHILPYQILSIARRLSMSLNIFISQLAPPSSKAMANPNQHIQQQIAHMSQATIRLNEEADNILELQLVPFKGDKAKVRALREGMRESLISSAVRSNPEVRQAMQEVVTRRNNHTASVPQSG